MEMVIENKAIEPVATGEVRAALDELLSAFEEFKAANDARLSEIEARGGADPLLEEKVARLDRTLEDHARRLTTLSRPDASGNLNSRAADHTRTL